MAESTPRPYTIGDLLRVMARLRDPESGCPWDREQSFESIAPYTIEEAYEVADAIARNDLDALRTITRFATGGLVPDLTFYIDVPVKDGIARKRRGETNRLDEKKIAYHERVRAGYLEMAKAEPARWVVIDGTNSVGEVQRRIRERLDLELKKHGF